MAARVRIKMDDTGRILLKRALNKDGKAQEKFTKECAKWMNNYVPFQTGRLKDMMVEIKTSRLYIMLHMQKGNTILLKEWKAGYLNWWFTREVLGS